MADELDLQEGDEARADEISASEQRRAARRSSAGSRQSSSSSKSNRSEDTGTEAQLRVVLDRVAEQREVKGDDELAEAIRETKDAIVKGFMQVTKTVAVLRQPLIFVLAIADPILAFWKVGSILTRRWFERRARKLQEYEEAAAAANANTASEYYAATGGASVN